jgi:hypothetical protein
VVEPRLGQGFADDLAEVEDRSHVPRGRPFADSGHQRMRKQDVVDSRLLGLRQALRRLGLVRGRSNRIGWDARALIATFGSALVQIGIDVGIDVVVHLGPARCARPERRRRGGAAVMGVLAEPMTQR